MFWDASHRGTLGFEPIWPYRLSDEETLDIRTEKAGVDRSELQTHETNNENYHRRSEHVEYSNPIVSCHRLTGPLSCQGPFRAANCAFLPVFT